MFEQQLTQFVEKHGLSEDVVPELVQLFNEALVEVGQGILKDTKVKNPKTLKTKIQEKAAPSKDQRWASKVAQAFAEEKELTLDDFPGIEKVTKQNMLDLLKKRDLPTPVKTNSPGKSPSNTTSTKRKVQCGGLTGKGEPCTKTGTVQPNGSRNHYCFRHADNWKDFETMVSSDSDSDEELEEEPTIRPSTPPCKETDKQSDSDEEPEIDD